jgi:cell division protein FtsX
MTVDNERVELGTGLLDRPIAAVLLVSAMMVSTFLAACFLLLP